MHLYDCWHGMVKLLRLLACPVLWAVDCFALVRHAGHASQQLCICLLANQVPPYLKPQARPVARLAPRAVVSMNCYCLMSQQLLWLAANQGASAVQCLNTSCSYILGCDKP